MLIKIYKFSVKISFLIRSNLKTVIISFYAFDFDYVIRCLNFSPFLYFPCFDKDRNCEGTENALRDRVHNCLSFDCWDGSV